MDAKVGDILVSKYRDFYEVRKTLVTTGACQTPEEAKNESSITAWTEEDIKDYEPKFYTPPKEKKFKLNGTYTKSQLEEMIKGVNK